MSVSAEMFFDYVDESGELLFQVVRKPGKQFLQRRPDGRGDWLWNLGDTRRVLYRLPALIEHIEANNPDPIYVVEGEKDVHAIEDAGSLATCNPMGAGKWTDEYAHALQGARRVVVVADRDELGRRHARQVVESLGTVGVAAELVEAREGKDASDHLAAGWSLSELELVPVEVAPSAAQELRVVTIEEFGAVEEPGAEALLGFDGEALIPADGDAMFFGDGGAGKTTLALDLACHLAAGDDWLDIPVEQPMRVLIVENEGPRPQFRVKLERKRAGWRGSPLGGRLMVLEEPWARITLPAFNDVLAAKIADLEVDVLVLGPVTRSGMNEAGTLQEVRDFMGVVANLRASSGRSLAVVLVHHENKAGSVSGAWEGAVDTLFHVQGQGHGRTRLYVQKARWASAYHATTLNLLWAESDSFAIEEREEITEATIAEQMLAAVRENPGASWTKIRDLHTAAGEKVVRGNATEAAAVRDRLLGDGLLVNVPRREGAFSLWVADDPAAPRSEPGTALERLTFHSPAEAPRDVPVPRSPLKGNGERNGTGRPGSQPSEPDPAALAEIDALLERERGLA